MFRHALTVYILDEDCRGGGVRLLKGVSLASMMASSVALHIPETGKEIH